jgi:hypothetical protein
MSGPNWTKLVDQGRAKAHGIPWSEEELAAIASGVSVEHVRGGILTPEAQEVEESEAEEAGKKPQYMKKDELLAKAKEIGIEIADEEAVTRADLITAIALKDAPTEEPAEAEKPAEESEEESK